MSNETSNACFIWSHSPHQEKRTNFRSDTWFLLHLDVDVSWKFRIFCKYIPSTRPRYWIHGRHAIVDLHPIGILILLAATSGYFNLRKESNWNLYLCIFNQFFPLWAWIGTVQPLVYSRNDCMKLKCASVFFYRISVFLVTASLAIEL